MKKIVDGNNACSKIAYYFSEVCSIYPITPSSPMASNIDALTSTNLLNIFNDKPRVLEMESEAGAAGHGSPHPARTSAHQPICIWAASPRESPL